MAQNEVLDVCSRCGAPIDWSHYGGARVAVDPDGGHHLCSLPPPPSILECICGAIVVDEADQRFDWPTRTPHVHRSRVQVVQRPVPTIPPVQEVRTNTAQPKTDQKPQSTPGGVLLEGLLKE